MEARDHLLLCGTKTDQCPNCRRFVQRAVFAYHYENNCADINETNRTRAISIPRSQSTVSNICMHEFY